jgi:quinol monooxygenase YgiN
MNKLWISAGIELEEGADLAAAEAGLSKLVEETANEPGCILFEIRQGIEDPNRFTLWECWVNEDALKAHFDMPHTKAYLARDLTKVSYIEKLGPIGASRTASAA